MDVVRLDDDRADPMTILMWSSTTVYPVFRVLRVGLDDDVYGAADDPLTDCTIWMWSSTMVYRVCLVLAVGRVWPELPVSPVFRVGPVFPVVLGCLAFPVCPDDDDGACDADDDVCRVHRRVHLADGLDEAHVGHRDRLTIPKRLSTMGGRVFRVQLVWPE